MARGLGNVYDPLLGGRAPQTRGRDLLEGQGAEGLGLGPWGRGLRSRGMGRGGGRTGRVGGIGGRGGTAVWGGRAGGLGGGTGVSCRMHRGSLEDVRRTCNAWPVRGPAAPLAPKEQRGKLRVGNVQWKALTQPCDSVCTALSRPVLVSRMHKTAGVHACQCAKRGPSVTLRDHCGSL